MDISFLWIKLNSVNALRMVLLTHMPGFSEFMLFVSMITGGISLGLTTIVMIILVIVNKENWETKRYWKVALKLFLIVFLSLTITTGLFLMKW